MPHRHHAVVDEAKLSYYLDDARRFRAGSKVGLFRDVLGFVEPDDLRRELLRHALAGAAHVHARTQWGVVWNVDGVLTGPRRALPMRTAWIITFGSATPRNTTAFPLPATRR